MILNLLKPQFILFYIIFFIPSLVIHEFSHAWVANKLGDSTAKDKGRLSLNPLVHLDLMGTIAILLIGFGWAKPVPVNPYNFKSIRRDFALVSFAGPASNLIIALLGVIILIIFTGGISSLPFNLIATFIQVNMILAIFNLIPLGPLDGFKIVSGILPTKLAIQWEEAGRYTYFLLIILFILPINGETLISLLIRTISNVLWIFI